MCCRVCRIFNLIFQHLKTIVDICTKQLLGFFIHLDKLAPFGSRPSNYCHL